MAITIGVVLLVLVGVVTLFDARDGPRLGALEGDASSDSPADASFDRGLARPIDPPDPFELELATADRLAVRAASALPARELQRVVEVVDEAGTPIVGAWIEVVSARNTRCLLVTLGDGIARSAVDLEAIESVRCIHPGFQPATRAGPFVDGVIDLTVERADPLPPLFVRVVDADGAPISASDLVVTLASDDPLAGAAWRSATPSRPRTIGGGDHEVPLDGAFAGHTLLLHATAPGRAPRTETATIPVDGALAPIRIEFTRIRERRKGRLVDRRLGTPITAATVTAHGRGEIEVVSTAPDRFELALAEPAELRGLRVIRERGPPSYFAAEALERLLVDGEWLLPLDSEGATLEATVRDRAGFPCLHSRVDVRYRWPDGDAEELSWRWTDGTGSVRFAALPSTVVEVTRVGGTAWFDTRTIDLSSGGRTRCDFVMEGRARLWVAIDAATRVEKVELALFALDDATADSGLSRGPIALDRSAGIMRQFDGLKPGRYLLRAWLSRRHRDRVVTARVGDDEPIEIEFREAEWREGCMDARCRDEAGECAREAK